ncbi:hypothetical protein RHMOL_Rhmol08G0247700 [Rhododendron molle]|uniref:Uncharacterized protein n=1 Tax=Rhododendron molle TaxID=49168 RepID=A0ACC0MU26_RHOML|nr:hypothetical protein RHMOL_Rhmol08G0247700 [Rhododendron molle]
MALGFLSGKSFTRRDCKLARAALPSLSAYSALNKCPISSAFVNQIYGIDAASGVAVSALNISSEDHVISMLLLGVISENSVILMCKFGSRTVPIKCCRSFTSYMDLVDKLCFKFSVLRSDSVRLFYNLRDYDGCVLANDDDLEVMFSLAGCFGVEVIDVTVVNSIGSSGCFGSDSVAIGVDRSESSCLTTDVGSDGLCGGSSGSYGSIFTSSKGKGSGVSCLSTDVGSVGLCGGSSGSYGSIFTSSKGKGSGVSCFGDVVASGVSGSSGSSDGLCSDVGSCSSSKGKGLAVIRSQWRTIFMEKLSGILDGDTRSIVFVSDRNAGIKAAVPRVFPSGFHGYCLYHLKNNLRGRLTGGRNKYKERVIGLFSLCAYAPNETSLWNRCVVGNKLQRSGVRCFVPRWMKL